MTNNYWSRKAARVVTRRRMLGSSAVAGAGLSTLLTVGCGDDDDDDSGAESPTAAGASPGQSPTEPPRGGTIRMPGSDGGIFDPAIANHGGTATSVYSVYDYINYLDTGFKLTAGMAELPEVVDERTLVYRIKPNVRWHDKPPLNGREFTAEDAAFGLARFGQSNPEFIYRDRFSLVDEYELVEKLTLRLTLSQPFSPISVAVAEDTSLMVSRDVVQAFGDKAVASDFDKAIGTGPFVAVSREEGVETVFDANRKYYRPGHPYVDQFRVLWFGDPAARIAAFVSGQVDFLNLHYTGTLTDLEAARDQMGKDEVTGVPNPVSFGSAIHFHTKVKPYDDPRVRTALHLAMDRHQVIASSQGSSVIGGPLPEVLAPYGFTEAELGKRPGYRTGKDREADLKEARALLDASGVDLKSLPKMQVWTPNASSLGQIVQQNWHEIGFNLEIQELGTNDALAMRQSRTGFSLLVFATAGQSDPDWLYNDLHSKGASNFGNFSDPEVDRLLEKGRTTFGVDERKKIYDDVQNRLLDDLNPRIYFAYGSPTVGLRSYLKGFRPTPGVAPGNLVLADMWFDK